MRVDCDIIERNRAFRYPEPDVERNRLRFVTGHLDVGVVVFHGFAVIDVVPAPGFPAHYDDARTIADVSTDHTDDHRTSGSPADANDL